jgi:hypothetical protein
MNHDPAIQKVLFENIRNRLSPHISLVDEVSDLLNVSTDSAYRRIRGEKPISLVETQQLAKHFNVSLDLLFKLTSDAIIFESYFLDEEKLTFEKYFEILLLRMEQLKNESSPEMIFQLNELNLFHVLQFPDLLAFKIHFWCKSCLEFLNYKKRKFTISPLNGRIREMGLKITDIYQKLTTTELLTREFLLSLLRQISFYKYSGYFEKKEDAEILCESALDLVEHLRKQAEAGYKYVYGSETPGTEGNFNLYFNDLTLIDNVILIRTARTRLTYLTNGAVNLLYTTNQDFFERNMHMVRTIMKKSTMISGNAEKERNHFFNGIRSDVLDLRDQLTANHY